MTKFVSGAATDVGQVRQVNQDHVLDMQEEGLFAVADGMGGHRGGEVASEVAIDALRSTFVERTTEALVDAVRQANRAIVARAKEDPDLRGMGTTMCALARVDIGDGEECLTVVNVGDSRAYLLKSDEDGLFQLSEDHSLVATLVRQGQLSPEEAAVHPQRNILTRALGIDQEVLPDSFKLLPVRGDRYLLCSDGLFNEVDEMAIASVLRTISDPTEAAEELVRRANEGGGRDNISVVIVDVVDDGGHHESFEEQSDDHRVFEVVHGPERVTDPARAVAVAAAATATAAPGVDGDGAGSSSSSSGSAGGTATAVAPQGVTIEAGASASPAPGTTQFAAGPGTSKVTWRVGLFVVAFLAIFAAAFFAVQWLATHTYYVGADQNEVVIFRGRPGGLLWYQPTVEQRTGIKLSEVPPQNAPDIQTGRDYASLDEATAYVANLRTAITTTTTTTTRPTTTTTTRPVGIGGAIPGGHTDGPDDVSTTQPAP